MTLPTQSAQSCVQRWFLFEVQANQDADGALHQAAQSGQPAFSTWAWLQLSDLLPLALPWRRGVYAHLARQFSPLIAQLNGAHNLPSDMKGMHSTAARVGIRAMESADERTAEGAVDALIAQCGAHFVFERASAALQHDEAPASPATQAAELESASPAASPDRSSHDNAAGPRTDVARSADVNSSAGSNAEPHTAQSGASAIEAPLHVASHSARRLATRSSASQQHLAPAPTFALDCTQAPMLGGPMGEARLPPALSMIGPSSDVLPSAPSFMDPPPPDPPQTIQHLTRDVWHVPDSVKAALHPPLQAHTFVEPCPSSRQASPARSMTHATEDAPQSAVSSPDAAVQHAGANHAASSPDISSPIAQQAAGRVLADLAQAQRGVPFGSPVVFGQTGLAVAALGNRAAAGMAMHIHAPVLDTVSETAPLGNPSTAASVHDNSRSNMQNALSSGNLHDAHQSARFAAQTAAPAPEVKMKKPMFAAGLTHKTTGLPFGRANAMVGDKTTISQSLAAAAADTEIAAQDEPDVASSPDPAESNPASSTAGGDSPDSHAELAHTHLSRFATSQAAHSTDPLLAQEQLRTEEQLLAGQAQLGRLLMEQVQGSDAAGGDALLSRAGAQSTEHASSPEPDMSSPEQDTSGLQHGSESYSNMHSAGGGMASASGVSSGPFATPMGSTRSSSSAFSAPLRSGSGLHGFGLASGKLQSGLGRASPEAAVGAGMEIPRDKSRRRLKAKGMPKRS